MASTIEWIIVCCRVELEIFFLVLQDLFLRGASLSSGMKRLLVHSEYGLLRLCDKTCQNVFWNLTGRSLQNVARQPRPDPDAPPEPKKPEQKINRAIVSRTIRLITKEGHHVLTRMEALRYAENMDLDLVEVDGKQDPPVCKLMDFNMERFKDRRRDKQLKKKQSERRRLDDLKEVRFSTRTEPNDLELKAQMALRLLNKGHRVKLAVIPHGNDDLEPKGRELLDRIVTLLQDNAKVEMGPRIEKQRAWVLIRPTSVGTRGSSTKKRDGKATIESAGDSSDSDSEDNDAG